MAVSDDGTNRPTPDPTILTTEQLLREIASIRDWTNVLVSGVEAVVSERFISITTQLQLIERQRLEQKADTEKAVQAALSAAKEAVKEQTAASEKSIDKAQTATSEQLKQQGTTFTTAIESQERQHNDLKERVSKIELLKQGGSNVINAGLALLAGLSSLAAVIAIVIAIVHK
jgi:hypothetical protein